MLLAAANIDCVEGVGFPSRSDGGVHVRQGSGSKDGHGGFIEVEVPFHFIVG